MNMDKSTQVNPAILRRDRHIRLVLEQESNSSAHAEAARGRTYICLHLTYFYLMLSEELALFADLIIIYCSA